MKKTQAQIKLERERILKFIQNYFATQGFAPSYAEIGQGTSLAKSVVHLRLKELQASGYLTKPIYRRARAITLTLRIVSSSKS